jgi:2'-5' RNA ligase
VSSRVSFWLVPAEPERARLQKLICDLAAANDGPVFEPHVTVYSGPLTAADSVPQILRAVARHFAPFDLQATGAGHSDAFTKTLFFEFAAHPALSELSDAFRQRMTLPEPYELKPHLSLLYASIPAGRRAPLAQSLSPYRGGRFDTISAITSTAPTRTRQDVEAWRAVGEQSLNGPSPTGSQK